MNPFQAFAAIGQLSVIALHGSKIAEHVTDYELFLCGRCPVCGYKNVHPVVSHEPGWNNH